MKSVIYSILAFFLIGFFLQSCEKEKEDPPLEITGQVMNSPECKQFLKTTVEANITPDTLSCIEYSYDPINSKLTLRHVNAGFNCCPDSLYCTVTTEGDTIAIQEFEKSNMCDCDCLYDLDIEINNVQEGKYQIKMIEPYAREEAKLSFEIDLAEEKSGSFCVVRKRYPWGIHQ